MIEQLEENENPYGDVQRLIDALETNPDNEMYWQRAIAAGYSVDQMIESIQRMTFFYEKVGLRMKSEYSIKRIREALASSKFRQYVCAKMGAL